jgi:hypothetical protein
MVTNFPPPAVTPRDRNAPDIVSYSGPRWPLGRGQESKAVTSLPKICADSNGLNIIDKSTIQIIRDRDIFIESLQPISTGACNSLLLLLREFVEMFIDCVPPTGTRRAAPEPVARGRRRLGDGPDHFCRLRRFLCAGVVSHGIADPAGRGRPAA